jgi:hypothetical protein
VQADGGEQLEGPAEAGGCMQVAVSSSARNELVGFGVTLEKRPPRNRKLKHKALSRTLAARAEQNPFSAELAAMAHVIEHGARAERLQDHTAHMQQSGGFHTQKPPTATWPGIRLSDIQVD